VSVSAAEVAGIAVARPASTGGASTLPFTGGSQLKWVYFGGGALVLGLLLGFLAWRRRPHSLGG
jgi:LPXTG-motif cell wall-anchored protein